MIPIDLTTLTPEQIQQVLDQDKKRKEAERLKKQEDNKALSELEDMFVDRFLDSLFERHNSVESLIQEMFKDFERLKPLKAEVKGVKIEKQYSHTITHSDKSRSITIGYNYTASFDGSEVEGITITKNYLKTLATDDPKQILANKIIAILLKTNPKTGELNVSKVLDLNAMRSDFNSSEFDRGMDILLKARFNKITSSFVSGWKQIEIDGRIHLLKFRFSV